MKISYLVIVIPLLLFSGCSNKKADNYDYEYVGFDSSRTISKVIIIDGMTCLGCEKTVNNIISDIKGVTFVKADYKTGLCEIRYDSALVDLQIIGKALYDRKYLLKGEQPTDQII